MLLVEQDRPWPVVQTSQVVLPPMRLVEPTALHLVLTVQLDPPQIYQSARLPDPKIQSVVQLVAFFLVLVQRLVVLVVVPVEIPVISTLHQSLLAVVIHYVLSQLPE